MSKAFKRVRGGGYVGAFHPAEADLLRSLVTQLLELLDDEEPHAPGTPGPPPEDPLAAAVGIDAVATRPDDPVLLRLFPDAYADDDAAAADFRRFTERALRTQKQASARAVLDSLAGGIAERPDRLDLKLDADAARAWLRTLTDLRLALGTRLGIEQDDQDRWAALPAEDPTAYVHEVYEWLGWLQETLVRALSKA